MKQQALAVMITMVFSLVGILGDYYLKLASREEDSLRSKWFYIGFVLYATTAFAWVYVMKHLKLATIGVVYSISMVVFLSAIGVLFFDETLNARELTGLVLAVLSLVLLAGTA